MSHLSDEEALGYVTGHCSEARQKEVEGHVAICPACLLRVRGAEQLQDHFEQVSENFTAAEYGRLYRQWRIAAVAAGEQTDANELNQKGTKLNSAGRYLEAVHCYDQALALDLNDARLWSEKGGSLNALGRYADAVNCYNEALALDPQDAEAWYNKALSQEAAGQKTAAGESYRRFIELAPPEAAAQKERARRRMRELEGPG